MFNESFKYDSEGFNLTLKKDTGFDKSKMRVMLVTQYICTADLKAKTLLSTEDTKVCVENVCKWATSRARLYNDKAISPKFMVFNFYAEKHFHLSTEQREEKEQEFANRLKAAVKKYRPTHILFCGGDSYATTTGNPYPLNRLGWVEQLSINGVKCYCTQTFDIFYCLGDPDSMTNKGQHSNHLQTVALHLSYLLNSEHPFSLKGLEPKPEYIDSKQKFDALMNLLNSSKYVALDTETRNLTCTANTVYTAQFASDKSDKGYVLALDHPQTPWSSKQIAYFKRKIKAFLEKESGPTLVTMNGKFDLRVLRRGLELPIINRDVWEITAGEHLLDETMSEWAKLQSNRCFYGNLRAILCLYMNDFYFRNEFTKEDRDTTGDTKPNDPAFLRYAAMDVCCLIPMMKMQVRRASFESLDGKSYKPYFIRHCLYEMSDTVHTLSHLDDDGSYIDMDYMRKLAGKDSPFVEQLNGIRSIINSYPETKKANKELLAEKGFKSKGLFGSSASSDWIFNIGKIPHRNKLFLEVMGLKAIDVTPKGEPSVGKNFIKAYGSSNQVVETFGQYQEVNKIHNAYIKSWFKLLTTNRDSINDHHLRPSYGFWSVSTGRISSQKPSLQVIPQHSDSAKYIKRAFVAPEGKLLVHYDYSAHEVRGWAITAGDKVLADAFRQGQTLRKKWIANPTEEVKKEMKTKGDIHVQNVHRFFNKWVDKKDPLRQAVKSVVFGVLYGKSAKTLGEDTKTGELSVLSSELRTAYHDMLKLEGRARVQAEEHVEQLQEDIAALKTEDRTEYAQHIIDKMYNTFKNGARWTSTMKERAEKSGYVYSPIGRIRHLNSAIFVNPKNKGLINKQIRRGSNAPIQGFASELAVKASRLTLKTFYSELPHLCELLGIEKSAWDLRVETCRMVHDASYYAVPYELVIPFIHISQWCATYGVSQLMEKQFGIKFNIEPEIEYELGTCDSDEGGTWDWSIPNLLQIVRQSLNNAHDRGQLEDVDHVYAQIMRPWKNKEVRSYLCSKYPLLNVEGLGPVIVKALKNEQHTAK